MFGFLEEGLPYVSEEETNKFYLFLLKKLLSFSNECEGYTFYEVIGNVYQNSSKVSGYNRKKMVVKPLVCSTFVEHVKCVQTKQNLS